jgi:hypothetical protein
LIDGPESTKQSILPKRLFFNIGYSNITVTYSSSREVALKVMLPRKSIKQSYTPSKQVLSLMQDYRQMTNDAIRIGLANNNLSKMKRLCYLSYKELRRYGDVPSGYKLCAISKAAEILASRKKSIKRRYPTRNPYVKRLLFISCYSFKIVNGSYVFQSQRGNTNSFL